MIQLEGLARSGAAATGSPRRTRGWPSPSCPTAPLRVRLARPVAPVGFEPTPLAGPVPETGAYANSATEPLSSHSVVSRVGAAGFEPAISRSQIWWPAWLAYVPVGCSPRLARGSNRLAGQIRRRSDWAVDRGLGAAALDARPSTCRPRCRDLLLTVATTRWSGTRAGRGTCGTSSSPRRSGEGPDRSSRGGRTARGPLRGRSRGVARSYALPSFPGSRYRRGRPYRIGCRSAKRFRRPICRFSCQLR